MHCSSYLSGVHDRSQRVSRRRLTGQLPIRADQKPSNRSVVQPLAQLVAAGCRCRFLDRIREDERGDLAVADLDCDVETPRPSAAFTVSAEHPSDLRNRDTLPLPEPTDLSSIRQRSALSPSMARLPTASSGSWSRFTHRGQSSAAVDTCDRQCPGRCLRDVGRPVSTGLHDSCRLSSFLTRWQREGQ